MLKLSEKNLNNMYRVTQKWRSGWFNFSMLRDVTLSKLRPLAARGHSDQMSSSDSIECVCVQLRKVVHRLALMPLWILSISPIHVSSEDNLRWQTARRHGRDVSGGGTCGKFRKSHPRNRQYRPWVSPSVSPSGFSPITRSSIIFRFYENTRETSWPSTAFRLISAVRPPAESADGAPKRNSTSRNVCNVPFKHIDVDTFFTDRNEVVERAISDCTEKLIKQNNDELVGSWLLTECVCTLYINRPYSIIVTFHWQKNLLPLFAG